MRAAPQDATASAVLWDCAPGSRAPGGRGHVLRSFLGSTDAAQSGLGAAGKGSRMRLTLVRRGHRVSWRWGCGQGQAGPGARQGWPGLIFSPTQVNFGILVAVTRVISQISADSYKVHGDPSAFK